MKTKKQRLFDIISIGNKEDLPSRLFDYFITVVILLNIAVVFIDTFGSGKEFHSVLFCIEAVTICIFIIEYILRLYTADLLFPGSSKKAAPFRFVISFEGIVDLLTILPFFFLSGFVIFRILRVLRIMNLFRINGNSDAFNIIGTVIRSRLKTLLSAVVISLILICASSLCMYSAEHTAQPDIFKNAFSGIWWSVNTILTIGYGDIYPVTALGKVMGTIISFLGVITVAIPTGIISAGFVEQYSKESNKNVSLRDVSDIGEIKLVQSSPMCGKSIYDIHKEFDARIMLVLRGNLTIMPTDDLTTQPDDILVIQTHHLQSS